MTTEHDEHEYFIFECIKLAQQARQKGNHPFGSVLVLQGDIIASSQNTVVVGEDITAHPELKLARWAAANLDEDELAQVTLYTSTEPCIMCSGALYWSGVSRVVFGCSAGALRDYLGEGADAFLRPCADTFGLGSRDVEVIGPILESEALKTHEGFW